MSWWLIQMWYPRHKMKQRNVMMNLSNQNMVSYQCFFIWYWANRTCPEKSDCIVDTEYDVRWILIRWSWLCQLSRVWWLVPLAIPDWDADHFKFYWKVPIAQPTLFSHFPCILLNVCSYLMCRETTLRISLCCVYVLLTGLQPFTMVEMTDFFGFWQCTKQ